MRTIFVSAGHGGADFGAIGNGYIEKDLTVEQRDLIVKELKILGAKVITDDNKNALAQTMRFIQNLSTEDWIMVDLHWNAFNAKSTGTEVFIPELPTAFENELATEIGIEIAKTLKIRNRGVLTESKSARKRLGWMRLKGENILIETCFLSNPNDMDSYEENKELLAKNISKILFNAAKDDIYIVKLKDSLFKIAQENLTTVEKIKKDNKLTTNLLIVGQKLKL